MLDRVLYFILGRPRRGNPRGDGNIWGGGGGGGGGEESRQSAKPKSEIDAAGGGGVCT